MARTVLSFAITLLTVTAGFASTGEAGSKSGIINQHSTIATAAMDSNKTAGTAKHVGCKKFFPAVGMALTVPCEADAPEPAVEAETPTPVIEEESPSITTESPSGRKKSTSKKKKSTSKKKSTTRKKRPQSTKTYRKRRARVGSCGGCRNSCYVRYRVRSHSRRFVPCMRRCWYQACR